MQSYEDAPPPYSTIVTNGTQIKGEYAAVPNYEVNPANVQLRRFCFVFVVVVFFLKRSI